MLWTSPSQIGTLNASSRPGVVAFQGQLHVVCPQQSTNKLVHATYDGSTWTSVTLTQTSTHAVSVAVFQDRLVCGYVDGNKKVQLLTWDPGTDTWKATLSTSFTVQNGVALASHDGLLHLAVTANASPALVQTCTWNGADSAWSAVAAINVKISPTTNHTPALVSHNGRLYVLFSVSSSENVKVYVYGGPLVSGEVYLPVDTVPGTTNNAQALVATSYNGMLTLFMTNSSKQNLAFAWTYGSWDAVTLPAGIPSSSGLGAAVYAGTLAVVTPTAVGSQYPLKFAEGVVGGVRPLGAQPLWRCAGTGYATTTLSSSHFWGGQPFTLEAWINPANLTGTQYILSDLVADAGKDPSGLVALALRDGELALYFAGRWIPAEGMALSPDDWTHVTATFDGRSVNLYIDGVSAGFLQFTLDDLVAPAASNRPVLIGACATSSGVTGLFSGTISRVAVFTGARSEAQVLQDRFTRLQPQLDLIALLDFGRATPCDRSTHSVKITAAGTPAYQVQTTALSLDGQSGLDCTVPDAEVPGDLSFAPSEDMTVGAWVYLDTSPTALATVLYRSHQYMLGINSDGSVVARAGGGTTYATASGQVLAGQWTHLATTWQGGALTVWVNGEAHSVSPTTAMVDEDSDHTTIGCRPSLQAGFKGEIATVSLWRRALSARELNALRAQGPIFVPGLAAAYDFCTASIEDTSAQNPVPTALGVGQALVLVSEAVSEATCATVEVVDVEVSNPFDPEEGGAISGLTLGAGQTVAGMQTLNSEQVVWLIKLLLTIVLGFAGILGVSPDSKLAAKLEGYLSKYMSRIVTGLNRYFGTSSKWRQYGSDAVSVLIALASNAPGLALDTLISLIANVILDMLRGLYAEGVLKSMFEIIADNLSWWDFANLVLNLAAFLLPGAGAAKVASMLIQFAILAEQLIRLALAFPRSKPALVAAPAYAAPAAPGAKRAAALQGQLSGGLVLATA